MRRSCLRKLRGLKHVRLVDASWVWTEHHSRRLRLKLTVARDLAGASGAAYMTCLQQSAVVEYTVHTRNCDACNKIAAKDTWSAKVQVRQRADHPRTLLALEQHMTKHQKSRVALREVKREGDGLDFYFGRRQDAHRFALGVCSLAPCRCKASSSLVAANARTGTSNVRHVWAIEIAPLCRDDLVLLPKGVAPSLNPLALVSRIGATVQLVDPSTGAAAALTADQYWRAPFAAVGSKRHLSGFVVIDCEPLRERGTRWAGEGTAPIASTLETQSAGAMPSPTGAAVGLASAAGGGRPGADRPSVAGSVSGSVAGSVVTSRGGRGGYVAPIWCPGEATVARATDFGANDTVLVARTHLSLLLEAGDEATGYDLEAIGHALDDPRVASGALLLPEVVLVAKQSAKQAARARERAAAGGRASGKARREGGKRRATRKPLGEGGSEVSSTTYQDSLLEEDLDLEGLDRMMQDGGEEEAEAPGDAGKPAAGAGRVMGGGGMQVIHEWEADEADGEGDGGQRHGGDGAGAGDRSWNHGGGDTQGGRSIAGALDSHDLGTVASAWLASHTEDHTGPAADLNQYWYAANTIATIAQVVREYMTRLRSTGGAGGTGGARGGAGGDGGAGGGSPMCGCAGLVNPRLPAAASGEARLDAAFLSTPSLFFALSEAERSGCRLLDFDRELGASEPCFVPFDFRAPEALPADLRGAFRAVIIDPPFITHEVWRAYAATARMLLAPGDGRLIIGTTVVENAELLREELGIRPHLFLPSIPHLPYQYALFSNCAAPQLDTPNQDVDTDPHDFLKEAAAAAANRDRSEAARSLETPLRDTAGVAAPYDFEAMLEAALRRHEHAEA